MKKYLKEIIITAFQLFMFYIFPLFAGPTDAMGMVFLIILATFILSFALGILSKTNLKFLYPFFISLLFIPSVFIYYNESALIHAVWYLVISVLGLCFGSFINLIIKLIKK
ncbi:MAG: hypothetical protein E7537_02480 [Ruminococcaceae bacterium]|nr:hypothetical protein [Oscillospiraceae bacterium]